MILTRKIIVLGGSVGGSVKLNHMGENIKGSLNLTKRVGGKLLLGVSICDNMHVVRLEDGESEFLIKDARLEGDCKCAVIEEGCSEPIALGSTSKDRSYAALLLKLASESYVAREIPNETESVKEELIVETPSQTNVIDESTDMPNNPDEGMNSESFINVTDVIITAEESEENFYDRIGEQMRDIFDTHSHNDELENLVFNSEWVNIDYDESSYYVLGVIKDENEPVFICYGVPSDNYSEPKEELGGMGQWLPVDRENTVGRGYYMLYQNAKTGEIL